ncbi:hypothetical protein DFS34DRAFT_295754 [Phlyctochytrium arcticum]|nr:hypothetical protein DFS34DRAFT_295754 [Phlyctochytrium arcticum]
MLTRRAMMASLLVVLALLLQSLPQALAAEDVPLPLGIPDPSTLTRSTTFYKDEQGTKSWGGSNYTFFMRYNITNEGTPDETLNILLALIGPSDPAAPGALSRSWMAIGYGDSMLKGEFNVCHLHNNTSAVNVHEHFSQKKYLAPAHYYGPNQLVTGIQGQYIQGQFFCHFTRKTRSVDKLHTSINIGGATRMIWAFNPRPVKNYRGEWFSYHQPDHRGAFVTNFADGMAAPRDTAVFEMKALHGFGMASIWMILFPASVFYARYLRSTFGWIVFHVSCQVVGIVGVGTFFVVILLQVQYWDRPHAQLGIVLIAFLVVQLMLGVLNVLGLSQEFLDRIRPIIRRTHMLVGFTLLIGSVVQIYLGLDTLYPFLEPRIGYIWGLYFGVLAFWIVAFVGIEIYYRLRIVRKDTKVRLPKHGGDGPGPASALLMKEKPGSMQKYTSAQSSEDQTMTRVNLLHENLKPGLRTFSWESLNEAILSGELLVVGNSRYVYDISKWITSHPGGQIILHAVCGTDISNDYFHEAGFDAEEFTPRASIPAQRSDRTHVATLQRPSRDSYAPSISESVFYSAIETAKRLPSMSETDWKHITKSRRTHVHTKLALQKLAYLIVGELMPSSPSSMTLNEQKYDSKAGISEHTHLNTPFDSPIVSRHQPETGTTFDRFEFRRYALTEKELISPTLAGTRVPVYRLRFCLLYPYDQRDNEPQGFLPGQCIELQHRINNRLVSRYYTPYTGNLTAFDIHVKMYEKGDMTDFLKRQRVGDRQYRIRGPFGPDILSPQFKPTTRIDRPLGPAALSPKRMLFFAGGSGVAPFYQIAHTLLLPLFEPLIVTTAYVPTIPDELALHPGDRVIAKHHYYDGWCLGLNLSTGNEGVYPLSATLPPCGLNAKVTLIHSLRAADEIFGKELLEGVMLAYPDILSVHYFIESNVSQPLQQGEIHQGRLTQTDIEHIVTASDWFCQAKMSQGFDLAAGPDAGEEEEPACAAYICGPPGYDGFVVDALSEAGIGNVRILPSDRFVI